MGVLKTAPIDKVKLYIRGGTLLNTLSPDTQKRLFYVATKLTFEQENALYELVCNKFGISEGYKLFKGLLCLDLKERISTERRDIVFKYVPLLLDSQDVFYLIEDIIKQQHERAPKDNRKGSISFKITEERSFQQQFDEIRAKAREFAQYIEPEPDPIPQRLIDTAPWLSTQQSTLAAKYICKKVIEEENRKSYDNLTKLEHVLSEIQKSFRQGPTTSFSGSASIKFVRGRIYIFFERKFSVIRFLFG